MVKPRFHRRRTNNECQCRYVKVKYNFNEYILIIIFLHYPAKIIMRKLYQILSSVIEMQSVSTQQSCSGSGNIIANIQLQRARNLIVINNLSQNLIGLTDFLMLQLHNVCI